MRINRTNRLALGVALLALALPAGIAAETAAAAPADKKYADLEARIAQLEAQLSKQQQAKPAVVNASMPADEAAPAAAAEAPAAPDPLAGIKSILGGVNLTGLADVYYGYNANHPAFTGTEPFSPRRDAFGLNLVELQLDKPVDKSSPFGFRVALGFGDAMTAVNEFCTPTAPGCFGASSGGDGDQTGTHYLKEGYGSYLVPVGKGLQLDFGKWVTPNGAEVIETNQNWNYSRSLLFYYAIPYYHFGGRVKYVVNDKITVIGYAANGWNNIIPDLPGNKTGGVTVVYSPTKRISIAENWMGGPRAQSGTFPLPGFSVPANPAESGHWNNLSDTVLTFAATKKLSLMANFDYDHQDLPGGGSADYTGVAGYAKYQANPNWAFAVRGEYLNDHDGFATLQAGGQHLWETTATLERVLANHVIARLEYRHDESNRDFFPYGSGLPISSQNTAKVGLVFQLQPIAQ